MIKSVVDWLTDFFKTYGLSATLILAACLLGIFNPGWLVKYEIGAIALFIFIAVVYLMFHVPTLWETVWGFLGSLWNKVFG